MTRPAVFHAALRPHPATPSSAVRSLTVDVDTTDAAVLRLHYRLEGDLDQVMLPVAVPPERTDDLWRHTCLELFVGAPDGAGCVEFNFSPSGAWAAYVFEGYRVGMRAHDVAAPAIAVSRSADALSVAVTVSHPFPGQRSEALAAGLAAVVESTDGGLSYWALTHPVARPDFHHRAGFTLRLGAAGSVALAEATP